MNINTIKKSTRCYTTGNKICLYDINIALTSYGPVVYQGNNKLDNEIVSLVTDYLMKYEYSYHGSISAHNIQVILSDGEDIIVMQNGKIIK